MFDDDSWVAPKRPQWRPGWLLFFGVVLPVAALATELALSVAAGLFFDPLPTWFHLLLVAFVAAANAWVLWVVRHERVELIRRAAFANSVTIGISGFYTLLFLPLLPIGVVATVFFGMGVLLWAPILSFAAALRLRKHLHRLPQNEPTVLRTWPGVLCAIAALVIVDLPTTITRMGARMAVADAPETRARGIQLLRTMGSDDALLRMCYLRSGITTGVLSFLIELDRRVESDTARDLYYRTTGQAFNSVPAPIDTRRFRSNGIYWMFDENEGRATIGSRLPGLSLASSRIDGSVDADAAVGYLEWTLLLRNASFQLHEGRAQIALPPGAVVSRVTLWVNGEEREAAFAGRGEVRQAYQQVALSRRDPLLVTTAGPDRITMQMFPVLANGEMKVRIGMTVPLAVGAAHEEQLRLPYFHERNFELGTGLRHSVWIESKAPLHGAGLAADTSAGAALFRADVTDAQLGTPDAAVVVSHDAQSLVWTADSHAPEYVVRQSVHRDETETRPRQLVVVMDGSVSMAQSAEAVSKAIAAVPSGTLIRLIFADDDSAPLVGTFQSVFETGGAAVPVAVRALSSAAAAREIASFEYRGGRDNTRALLRGLDLLTADRDSALLWIHGPQPMLFASGEPLRQQLERTSGRVKWYDLQVVPGGNVIMEKLAGLAAVDTLRPGDLQRLVSVWQSGKAAPVVTRERVAMKSDAAPIEPGAHNTSAHLARLWANDEITRLMSERQARRAEAVGLAQTYQLVTPVSGAVVLETQQQYAAAGLEPVPEGSVPTIPEPEEWALIIAALGVLGYVYWRRRANVAAQPA